MSKRSMSVRAGLLGLLGLLTRGQAVAAPPAYGPEDPPIAIALGEEHSCALTRAGLVSCWGRNYSGQLVDGTREDRAVPAPVVCLDQVVQLAAFGARTCAARLDGTLWCWG